MPSLVASHLEIICNAHNFLEGLKILVLAGAIFISF